MLLVAAVVLAGAWALAGLPGRISGEIGNFAFEAPTPIAALALALLFILLYGIFRLFGAALRLPRTLHRRQAARRRHAGDAALTRTLLALAAGESGDARREANRARRLLGDTPATLLLAAESGRLAGRLDEAEMAYRALADRDDAAFLGLRGLLRQAIEREDWSSATALARQAERVQPGAAWLRRERARLAVRAGEWADALALADADAPKAALAAAAAEAASDPGVALRLARQAWQDDPALAPAALAYASRLRAAGREHRALAAIRHSWEHRAAPRSRHLRTGADARAAAAHPGGTAADRGQSGTRREPAAAGADGAGCRADRRGAPACRSRGGGRRGPAPAVAAAGRDRSGRGWRQRSGPPGPAGCLASCGHRRSRSDLALRRLPYGACRVAPELSGLFHRRQSALEHGPDRRRTPPAAARRDIPDRQRLSRPQRRRR